MAKYGWARATDEVLKNSLDDYIIQKRNDGTVVWCEIEECRHMTEVDETTPEALYATPGIWVIETLSASYIPIKVKDLPEICPD